MLLRALFVFLFIFSPFFKFFGLKTLILLTIKGVLGKRPCYKNERLKRNCFYDSVGMFKFMDKCENDSRMVKTSFLFLTNNNCKVSVYSPV